MDYTGLYVLAFIIALFLLAVLYRATRSIPTYAVGIVTMFGAYKRIVKPGMNIVNPLANVWTVDLRGQSRSIPPSNFPTTTGVPVIVGGSVDYHVTDAPKSFFQVPDFHVSILGEFRERLARAIATTPVEGFAGAGWQLAERVRAEVAESSAKFGVAVDRVELTLTTPQGPLEFFAGKAAPGAPLS